MTSAEIRQSFLDFFREKQHAIVPSFHSIAARSSSSDTVAKLVAESLIA